MIRHSTATLSISVGAALIVASMATTGGAGATISGRITIAGVASSADAVVYVQQAPVTPAAAARVDMDQRKMQFLPHVLPVVAGTTVRFLNSDPTPHNVFTPDNEKYNLGTWPQGQTKEYTFSKCTKFPCVYVQLCRVHPEMEGYVVVLQNPFFAVTDKEGKYEIQNVPPGSYTLGVWHQKAKAQTKAVTVEAGKPATVDFALTK